MHQLNNIEKHILSILTDNYSFSDIINLQDYYVLTAPYGRDLALALLQGLNKKGMLNVIIADNGDYGQISFTADGFLFLQHAAGQTCEKPQIIINNSTGVNIGDNNTVNMSNGISGDCLHRIISEASVCNAEVLHELIDTLQDCFENSKPLPKGKFTNAIVAAENVTSILTGIGSFILQLLSKG